MAIAATGVLLLAACTTSSSRPHPGPATTSAASSPRPAAVAASTGWQPPADVTAAATQAGLPMLGQEMLAVHYHAHLNVQIAGQPVAVPAGLGIDLARRRISPLHTHDASGVIHIESQANIPYTLGQLFIEWGQPLSARQVGPHRLAPGEVLRVFRDGRPVAGDPAALRFAQHDEDLVWVGPASAHPTVPSTYAFPAGLLSRRPRQQDNTLKPAQSAPATAGCRTAVPARLRLAVLLSW